MVKAKKDIFQKILSIVFAVMTVFSAFSMATVPASAANGSHTYTVTTKANYWYPGSESITVKQVKEKYYSNKKKSKTKTRNALVVTVKCTPTSWSGNKKPKTVTETFSGSSKTIKLEKNATYRVNVSWRYVITAYNYGTVDEPYAYISGTHKAKVY